MPKTASHLGLGPQHLRIVTEVLREHLADAQVFAYGSRACGTARKYSDLDLAILAPQPLSLRQLRRLREAFEDSELPICVDLTDWSQADADFREAVLQGSWTPLQ